MRLFCTLGMTPEAASPGRICEESPVRIGTIIGLISPLIRSTTMQVFGFARNNAPGFATRVFPVRCCSRT